MDNLSVGIPRSSANGQRAETYPRLKLSSGTKPQVRTPTPVAIAGTPGRDHPEQVVAIAWNGWSQSAGISGRDRVEHAHHLIAGSGSKIFLSRDPEPRLSK